MNLKQAIISSMSSMVVLFLTVNGHMVMGTLKLDDCLLLEKSSSSTQVLETVGNEEKTYLELSASKMTGI